LVASQSSAVDLVAAVNSGVATLRRANAASEAPSFGLPSGIDIPGICSTGTASYDVSGVTGTDLTGATIGMSFNNCVFGQAAAAGVPAITYNGGYNIFFERYTQDFSNYKFISTYNNLSVAIAGFPTEAFTGTITCEKAGSSDVCTTIVDGNQIGEIDLSIDGNRTTIRTATIRGNVGAANGYVDCVYAGWTVEGNFATSGTVTITGASGSRAVIRATATGYVVEITVNGTTTTYNIPRG
jgi:hypothetical protein